MVFFHQPPASGLGLIAIAALFGFLDLDEFFIAASEIRPTRVPINRCRRMFRSNKVNVCTKRQSSCDGGQFVLPLPDRREVYPGRNERTVEEIGPPRVD